MSDSEIQPYSKRIVLLASLLLVVYIAILSILLYLVSGRASSEDVPSLPPGVESFLDELFYGGFEFYSDDDLFCRYFNVSGDPDCSIVEENFFSTVAWFLDNGFADVKEISIDVVSESFCIIRMYADSGKTLIPPPVGFWYKVNADGKIVDYALARLLPFSRYDSEFSEDWYAIK